MSLKLPPGPGPRGTLAFVRAAAGGEILEYFRELARRYGPVSSLPLGPERVVFVDEPRLIEEILVTRQHEFVRDTGAALLRELVGEGLLTTEDPAHLKRRRLMQPAFHRARVAAYASTIVAETERVLDGWDLTQPLDLGVEMARIALAAVGSALFGADLRERADEVAHVLASVTERGGALAGLLAVAGPLIGPLRRAFPRAPSLLFPRERARLEAIVAPLVANARERADGDDLLALLLAARADGESALDDAAVRNEICMLVLAGHETTANALTWAWIALAEHPTLEARVFAEVDAVIGDRSPALADVTALPYTTRVFDETLRLYPPAAAFARRPMHPIEIGGFRVPRRASIYVSPYVTQRNARFFAEPDAFVPDRWEGAAPAKFAFFPFGGGSKMCIGEPFARLEAILVLAAIARRFRFERIDTTPTRVSARALLKPASPVLVRAYARASEVRPSRPSGANVAPSRS